MAEYSFKCGSGLKTSKKCNIILSSKLLKPKIVSVKKIQKWLKYFLFTNPIKNTPESLEYEVMMCFDTGVVD